MSLNLVSDVCLQLPDRQVSSSVPQKSAPIENEIKRQKNENDSQTKYLNWIDSSSQSISFPAFKQTTKLISEPQIEIGLLQI